MADLRNSEREALEQSQDPSPRFEYFLGFTGLYVVFMGCHAWF